MLLAGIFLSWIGGHEIQHRLRSITSQEARLLSTQTLEWSEIKETPTLEDIR